MRTSILFQSAALLAGLAVCGAASASCYTIYSGKGALMQRTGGTPVDMSYQLRHTVPKKFGGGASMVFETAGETCTDYSWRGDRSKRRSKIEDTNAILDGLVLRNDIAKRAYRGDTWLTDVDFKSGRR